MRSNKKIIKLIMSVSGLIVLEKILGFVKQVTVASSFGATIHTDIINLSQGLVSDIQYVLSQALITSFISIYILASEKEGENSPKRFAGNTILLFSGVSLVLSLVLYAFAPVLAKVLAPSYSIENLSSLTHYIRIYSPVVLLFILICVFKATLNANKRFAPEQISNINQSTIIILLVFIFGKQYGPKVLVVGFFLYTIWNVIYLGFLCRKDVTFSIINPLSDKYVKELLKMMGPLLISYSLIYVNQMVDKILVSQLGEGVITSLAYGSVLSGLITTFIITFCNIFFSYVTTAISNKQDEIAAKLSITTVDALIIFFLPISFITIVCSHDIVQIVYGHGAFDSVAVESSSWALRGYACMFIPVVFREVFTRLQYGYQESKKPMVNGAIGIIINILLSIALCSLYGVFGVSLATSLSVLVCAALNVRSAKKINKLIKFKETKRKYYYILGTFLLTVIFSMFIHGYLKNLSSLFRFIVFSLIVFCVYVVLLTPIIKQTVREIKAMK